MREIVEVRWPIGWSESMLGDLMQTLDRKTNRFKIDTKDPLFQKLTALFNEQRKSGGRAGSSTYITRYYSKEEINAAELLQFIPNRCFEPCGEECGTKYDESTSCPECRFGRRQVSDLVLDLRKAPKTADLAVSIGREYIISQHLAEIITQENLTGIDFRPVHHKARYIDDPVDLKKVPSGRELIRQAEEAGYPFQSGRFYVWLNRSEQNELSKKAREEHSQLSEEKARAKPKPIPVWYQPEITSKPLQIMSPPTKAGNNPFDEDPENKYRCTKGHVLGLNILSEVWVSRESWDGSDICLTSQAFGHRRGLLVPGQLILISPRFYRLLVENNIKSYKVEVAHLI